MALILELLYLSNIAQLQDVLDSKSDFIKDWQPITGDMTVAFELEKLGIVYLDERDFLTVDDIKINNDTANILASTWWDEDLARTDYEGAKLATAVQEELVWPFEACLNARTVYGRLFKTFDVTRIYGYFLSPVGISRCHPVRGVVEVTEATIFYLANQCKIPIEPLSPTTQTVDAKANSISDIFNCRPSFNRAGGASSKEKIVLVYEQYMPPSEHAELLRVTSLIPGARIVSVTQAIFEIASRQRGLKETPSGRFSIFWERLVARTINYQGPYSELFANMHLLFQFERIRQEMERSFEYGSLFQALLEVLRPSLVIFAYEGFAIERTLVRLAKRNGITTIALLHGGSGHNFGYRNMVGDADYILTWNELDIESLVACGVSADRLRRIGCLRYETAYRSYRDASDGNVVCGKSEFKKNIGFVGNKPLIVFLANQVNVGLATSVANPRKHREALWGFLSLVRSRPDLQFIIKAHSSYDYHALYRQMLGFGFPNLRFDENISLTKVLEAADICFMMNYCTTAGLEALLSHLPLLFLDNAIYPIAQCEDALSRAGICRVSTIKALEVEIDYLLTGSKKSKYSKANDALTLKLFLGDGSTSVGEQLRIVIDQLLCAAGGVGSGGLNGEAAMRVLLTQSDGESAHLGKKKGSKHSSGDIILALVYFAGTFTLGSFFINRIIEFSKSIDAEDCAQPGNDTYWDLLQLYVTACFVNPGSGRGFFSRIEFVWHYLLHPNRYFSTSTTFQRLFLKYLLQQVFGHKAKTVYQLYYSLVKLAKKGHGTL